MNKTTIQPFTNNYIEIKSLWIAAALLFTCLSSFVLIISGKSSIGFSLFFFLSVGLSICLTLGGFNKTVIKNLLIIFFINLFIYLVFAFFVNYSFHKTNEFFIYPDQYHFFEHGEKLGLYSSISEIFQACFIDRIHLENEAAHFLHGTIAFTANKYFDGNSVLLQIIHTSFWGIIISLFIFKTLLYYVPSRKAFKYTLLYSLLSPIFYYSPWILRDIHVALLYSAGIFIIHTNFSLKRLIILLVLTYITIEFRLQHGMFYMIIPVMYVLMKGRTHKYYRVVLPVISIVFLLSLSAFLTVFWPKIEFIIRNFQSYSAYTDARVGEGFGSQLYALPSGIKHFSIAAFSQISQFPPWVGIEKADTFVQGFIGSIEMISSLFWSYIFIFFLIGLFFLDKPPPKNLLILMLIAVIFLVSNTANMNVRRIIGIYPIIYVLYVNIRESLSQVNKRQVDLISISIYMLLIAVYLQLSLTKLI